VIGACLAPRVDIGRLVATILAFLAAVGIAAHALDELHGRPLHTEIPSAALVVAAAIGLAVAVGLGAAGVVQVGAVLIPFIVIGPFLVVAYNAELFGGVVHTDIGFALAWGSFPVIVGYVAQAGALGLPTVLGAATACALSLAQRALSTPARLLRRQVRAVHGVLTLADGTTRPIDDALLRLPLERALRAMSWGLVTLAAGLAVARLR
jgi:hypothetical protein